MTVLTRETPSLSPQREVSGLDCDDSQIRNLWQAVIEQAALDLRGAVGHRSKIEREDGVARASEASEWVRGNCCHGADHFAEVCDLAGVEAAPVREKILRSLQFPAVKRSDVNGLIVEPKYCEVCGKSFLRPQGDKQATCAPCSAREASRVATQPLSSAVSLGIRFLESDPDTTPQPDKPYVPGDLLRMTCLAANVPNQTGAQRRWPWLGEDVETPCDCETLISPNALLVLQHLYETHVRARQDWAAEEFVAWVQKHEHLALAPEQPEQPQDDAQVSDSPVPEFADAICVPGKAGAMEQDHAGAWQ